MKVAMEEVFTISQGDVRVHDIARILDQSWQVRIAGDTRNAVRECRCFLEEKLEAESGYYGINTGFGSLYRVRIEEDEMDQLQQNLVLSHAAGAGERVSDEVVRVVLLLKIISLAKAKSGVRPELIDRLIELYNASCWPVLYAFGSLGASGDLAPLAHLSLPLIGCGALSHHGVTGDSQDILKQLDMKPLRLKSKEGLALINGTQFSTGYGLYLALRAKSILGLANLCAAASLDAFDCNLSPFDDRIQQVRPHIGQSMVARQIRRILEDSEIGQMDSKQLQDPYAFRCIPQVHGATFDVLQHTLGLLEIEINSVTDNPIIFPESDAILSGGNFHAQPVAMVLDYLAIAMAELGNIAERRTYQLLSGQRDLPDFLIRNAGMQSGLMIAQYTAASVVNRNKTLCAPASIDSITSSKGQEDHVSMSANAALKLDELLDNVMLILGIEWLCAMQALDFRAPYRSSSMIMELHGRFRDLVPFQKEDRTLHQDMDKSRTFLESLETQDVLETVIQSDKRGIRQD